jgi:transglutaminase-like putative cysteine protease
MHAIEARVIGAAMPILTIRHTTIYRYRRPVAFGEHRMMLRPRDDRDQTVLASDIDIVPTPSELAWTQDIHGNHLGVARFADRCTELRFESFITVDHAPASFSAGDIVDDAKTYPFRYRAEDQTALAPFIVQPPPGRRVERFAQSFLRADGAADTHALLTGMTQAIRKTFRHGVRHQKGTREPLETLERMSGSCRDLAQLMIAALRSLGIAARFVSGYLNLVDPDDESITGGNTHAWVQAYVPGPGWVDFDPSSGMVGNENLVRVAVVHGPNEAIPLEGTFIGSASDHLTMNVAVKVTAAAQSVA